MNRRDFLVLLGAALSVAGALLAIAGLFLPWFLGSSAGGWVTGIDLARHFQAPEIPGAITVCAALGLSLALPRKMTPAVIALGLGVVIAALGAYAYVNFVPMSPGECITTQTSSCDGGVKPVGSGLVLVILGGAILAGGSLLTCLARRSAGRAER